MIEETLKLKRFTDKSIAALFASPKAAPAEKLQPATDKDEEMDLDEDEAEDAEDDAVIVSGPMREKQLDLQDAVRTGFKAGMGSRQNAPAEWIGELVDSVPLHDNSSQSSQTPGPSHAPRTRIRDRGCL
jgi:cullin-4